MQSRLGTVGIALVIARQEVLTKAQGEGLRKCPRQDLRQAWAAANGDETAGLGV